MSDSLNLTLCSLSGPGANCHKIESPLQVSQSEVPATHNPSNQYHLSTTAEDYIEQLQLARMFAIHLILLRHNI